MPSSQSVEVDLILNGLRLQGAIGVDDSRRVSDILNSPESSLLLSEVVVATAEGTRIEAYPQLAVEKRNLLAVVPRESSEYLTSHQRARFGVARPALADIAVGVVLPPYNAHGVLLIPPPVTVPIAIGRLSHFFPLLRAALYLSRVLLFDDVTLLVNRDLIVGLGPLEEGGESVSRASAAFATVPEVEKPSPEDELISRLMRELAAGGDSPSTN